MGVRLLSTLLRSYCPNVAMQIGLSELHKKKICIDISIYLYRYKAQNALLEKIYLMCAVFKYYNIIPIFVFDGKPPSSKYNELKNRREKRVNALAEYNRLKKLFGEQITTKQDTILQKLKRSSTFITKVDIALVKDLLDAYGMKHITALGEADVFCASLVLKKKAYAVLTEDMDLFAYGCTKVLRYLSLTKKTCLMFNIKDILNNLDMSLEDFQELCVLSGTDYNTNKKNIFYYLKLYHNRYKNNQNNKVEKKNFLSWLCVNKYINIENYDQITEILNNYKNANNEINKYKYFNIRYGAVDKYKLNSILEQERFLFA